MNNCYTIDIEGALVDALIAEGYKAFAPPVSADVGAGSVYVWRIGGSRQSYVQDWHQLSVDCYGTTSAEAMSLACELTGWLGDLEGQQVGGVPVYQVRITTLPYENPDPVNYSLRRSTFAARVITRVKHDN